MFDATVFGDNWPIPTLNYGLYFGLCGLSALRGQIIGHSCNGRGGNQIYLVMLRPTQLTQASFLQKNQMLQNVFFFDNFNAEIAQCCQKLDVILGTKVVQFCSYHKIYLIKMWA